MKLVGLMNVFREFIWWYGILIQILFFELNERTWVGNCETIDSV
jgi:hypothetical protein